MARPGPQRAFAEGVFKSCGGLTSELIIAKLEVALEQAFAEGAASTAKPARSRALKEIRSALQGVENSLKQHVRTCEIEIAALEGK